MPYLIAVTLLWAFSFSLIGVYLREVDPWFSVWARTLLASLVFLPFIKFKAFQRPIKLKLMAIGAIQLGLMYGFYYHSFLFLTVPEVLLFTILTPLYVTLFNDLFDKRFNSQFFTYALLAVAGAFVIRFNNISSDFFIGLILVQCANVCFALGQVSYKRLIVKSDTLESNQASLFGFFYIGALILATITYLLFGNLERLPTTTTEWSVLVYLGVIASGLGYYGWNKGATEVNIATLAVMNNLLIPVGILVNLAIWNREANLANLTIGGLIILASILLSYRNSRVS